MNIDTQTRPFPVAPETPKQPPGFCNLYGEPITEGRSSACPVPENIVNIDRALKEQAKLDDSPIHDHVDEVPRDDTFDLSTYLVPGYYDYFQLHDAYLKACEAKVGAQFRLSICSQGEPQSKFWNAMLAAHHSKILCGEEHAPAGTISIAEAGPVDQNPFAKIGKTPATPLNTIPPTDHIGTEYHRDQWKPRIVPKESSSMTDQDTKPTGELTETFGPWAADPEKLKPIRSNAAKILREAKYIGPAANLVFMDLLKVKDMAHLQESTAFETPAQFLDAVQELVKQFPDAKDYAAQRRQKQQPPADEGPHAEWVDDNDKVGLFFDQYKKRVWGKYDCTDAQAQEQRKKTLHRLTEHDSLKWWNKTAAELLVELGLDFQSAGFKLKEQPAEDKPAEQSKPVDQPKPSNGNGNKPPAQENKPAMALVPQQPSAMTFASPEMARFEVMRQQAQVLLQSGFLPQSIRTPEQAIAIMMMGEAIGVKPIVALNTINIIQGKPTVSPQLMLALVRNSGQLENFSATDDGTTCTVKMKRKNELEHVETFSMQDASAMKLSDKDNWKKQPATMRKWRAIAAACRVVFPDVTWGIASYTAEELNPDVSVDIDGVVVEAA